MLNDRLIFPLLPIARDSGLPRTDEACRKLRLAAEVMAQAPAAGRDPTSRSAAAQPEAASGHLAG